MSNDVGPAAWNRDELEGLAYRCLEDCGFCCTFTPEVEEADIQRLRAKFPQLPLARREETIHIGFQGGCGACTLLQRRKCTAYEERPAHCRYFPFHVYFGSRTEVYVNRSCRGVDERVGSNLHAAFMEDVVRHAPPARMLEREREARKVHRAFRENAGEAGMWSDPAQALADALASPRRLVALADDDDAWSYAFEAFEAQDVVERPYYLDDRLRWITFEAQGDALQPLAMEEDGSLAPLGAPIDAAPSRLAGAGVPELLARLSRRDLFFGQAFDAVDANDYEVSVADAVGARLGEMCVELMLRQSILERLGVAEPRLADEALRFYDSAFLDAPTVGGWL